MPYFQINGIPILPNKADCPVEIIKQEIICNSSGSAVNPNDSKKTFFATANDGSGGQVVLTGVTDSGYKLITADNATYFDILKNQNIFNNKLKVTNNGNTIIQKYCKKGYAPTGSHMWETTVAYTYYLVRYTDGKIELQKSDGTVVTTLCTAKNKKCVITFVQVGGGGGGGGGSWSNNNGGGGGGGAASVFTIIFPEELTQTIKLLMVTGSGGSGGGDMDPGHSGNSTYVKMVAPIEKMINECYGGGGGGDAGPFKGNGDYGRGGSLGTTYNGTITDSNNNKLLYVYNLCAIAGEPGRTGANSGPKNEIGPILQCANYTVTSNWKSHIGGRPKTSGGTTQSIFSSSGGSGGNTPVTGWGDVSVATNYVHWFSYTDAYYGCGGHGGGGVGVGAGKTGDSGIAGAMRLFY